MVAVIGVVQCAKIRNARVCFYRGDGSWQHPQSSEMWGEVRVTNDNEAHKLLVLLLQHPMFLLQFLLLLGQLRAQAVQTLDPIDRCSNYC